MDIMSPCACKNLLRGCSAPIAGGQIVTSGCGMQMQEGPRTEDSAMKARLQESPVRPSAPPELPSQAGQLDAHLEDPKTPDRPIVSGAAK